MGRMARFFVKLFRLEEFINRLSAHFLEAVCSAAQPRAGGSAQHAGGSERGSAWCFFADYETSQKKEYSHHMLQPDWGLDIMSKIAACV